MSADCRARLLVDGVTIVLSYLDLKAIDGNRRECELQIIS